MAQVIGVPYAKPHPLLRCIAARVDVAHRRRRVSCWEAEVPDPTPQLCHCKQALASQQKSWLPHAKCTSVTVLEQRLVNRLCYLVAAATDNLTEMLRVVVLDSCSRIVLICSLCHQVAAARDNLTEMLRVVVLEPAARDAIDCGIHEHLAHPSAEHRRRRLCAFGRRQ